MSGLYLRGVKCILWLVLGGLLCAGRAGASGVVYDFDQVFSGTNTPPAGSAPWVEAAFTTNVTSGNVDLTVTNLGLTGTEFVSELFFNLNTNFSSADLSGLSFALISSNGNFGAMTIDHAQVDHYMADGDGRYDIHLSFSTDSGMRFGAGDYLIYEITGISGLTPEDFTYLSAAAGGAGPFYAAAHIQGIDPMGTNSCWISPSGVGTEPVPEPVPSHLLLVSIGLFGAARLWLRRR